MTGVAQAMQKLGLDGAGVKVCIVDSGVDYNHPELGGCWKTEGCPWQLGKDLIGDKYNYESDNPIIEPNETPMDCFGHGTHVSGIIAGRGPQVQGVAPGATMGMYRIFSCAINGTLNTDDSIIMQGMEEAHKDGCDIINLSLGGGGGWVEDPTAVLATNIVEDGGIVIAAVGNDGDNGIQTAGTPAAGKGVIGVAAVENWNITAATTLFSTPAGDRIARTSGPAENNVPFAFENAAPLAVFDGESNTGCNATETDFTGKVVLVMRGDCDFVDKANNVQNQGGIGMVIINNVPEGIISLGLAIDKANITIPCTMITDADGLFIADGISQGDSTVVTKATTFSTFADPNGGKMVQYSSYGPDAELNLVPQISAPGGNIWSTYPLDKGSYMSLTGTSMATPYISGCAALLKQQSANFTSAQIKNILTTTAVPLTDSANNLKVSPHSSGSGLVNVYNALTCRAVIDPPLISINNTDWAQSADNARSAAYSISFTNADQQKGVDVVVTHNPASSLTMYDKNGTYAESLLTNFAMLKWPPDTNEVSPGTIPQVTIAQGTQHVAAGESATFNITITLPSELEEAQRWYFGGFLNFTLLFENEDTTVQHVVPYGGFNGDYTAIDVISPESLGLPLFADAEGNLIKDISTYSVTPENPAMFMFGLDVPVSYTYITLVDSNEKTVGYVPEGFGLYLQRSFLLTSSPYIVPINNTIVASDDFSKLAIVPDGKYSIKLYALRPLSDPNNEDDYQVWKSPPFEIGS
ncbi:hypothetical protein LPJ55_003087 [Coemansia sp. RSA 990]|nr:hypothetical protein LPJ55_003087 [Coemansia sp. RSA 990]